MLYESTVRYLVMQRQCLDSPVDLANYNDLFRLMSPAQPRYWTMPGSPPELTFRAGFQQYGHVFDLRKRRIIVKGRFQGGLIGYVFADELPLFMSVYAKSRKDLTFEETELLSLLETEGPMNIAAIKEITGWLSKNISPVLHKLQQKFLVYEDQVDNEWDRAWFLMETEFPDASPDTIPRNDAIKELIQRFSFLNVFIDAGMVQSFYKLKPAEIKEAIESLQQEGRLEPAVIGDKEGSIRPEDRSLLESEKEPAESIFVMHRNDFLVRSHEHTLKKSFSHPDHTTLQYILIKGRFRGCSVGAFRNNGPFDLEDIILDLDETEDREWRETIIETVAAINEAKINHLKRYRGIEI